MSSMPSPHKIYLAGRICRETAPRRVLTVSNINSDATGVDINTDLDIDKTQHLKYTKKK